METHYGDRPVRTYVVYFNTGESADRTVEIKAIHVREAVDLFFQSHGPITAILAIIEKDRTL